MRWLCSMGHGLVLSDAIWHSVPNISQLWYLACHFVNSHLVCSPSSNGFDRSLCSQMLYLGCHTQNNGGTRENLCMQCFIWSWDPLAHNATYALFFPCGICLVCDAILHAVHKTSQWLTLTICCPKPWLMLTRLLLFQLYLPVAKKLTLLNCLYLSLYHFNPEIFISNF